MESPILSPGYARASSSTSRSSLNSLTSYNPFAEEDENDQSSYALVTSLFSRVKNFASPLTSVAAGPTQPNPAGRENGPHEHPRRPSIQTNVSNMSSRSGNDRPNTLNRFASSAPAPPLVSVIPVTSEAPTFNAGAEYDRPPSRGYFYSPVTDTPEGGGYGTAIPGFPIQQDSDTRSIRTTNSIHRSGSVSKKIRRIRGEGLSRDYWMDDELCKECYDCNSVFTAWRRKHHCRICGQVFCSRCASNIIKGSRFGHDGMVRVCNLCLEKLSKVDDEDDDDRRSIVSSSTSPFPNQLGNELGLGRHPQSPFAASQLFGRKDEPFNLFSIAETKRPTSGSDESMGYSRGSTPESGDDSVHPIAAPFRRTLAVEDSDPLTISTSFRDSPFPAAKTPIDFPITVPVTVDGAVSSVTFPMGTPDPGNNQYDTGDSAMRSRFNSYADFDMDTPFIRSRVQSRIPDSFIGEPGWRTRRESTAYAQELNLISMFHLRIMLRQMLTTESIPNIKEWEETLLKLALRIARDLTFTAHPQRQGADMDVRNYVKIKKIPGGAPKDSEFVDGAVITKNVAHKAMSRFQHNPRVMLVTFPLEFNRVEGQYMQFGQIVRQEKEYLNNLATRIAALRPHVVLVETSVSRIALDALAQHKIGVARMVKDSAIEFVARMTQGDVFSSMDRLALEPRLGHCAEYRIQTFDHPLIPGRRKTYMRFEGCNREMGCTILLRGGDIDTLTRIKRVTRFLTFIVRNLKLETHLWKDSVITLPNLTMQATPQPPSTTQHQASPFASVPSLWASFSNLKIFSQSPIDPPELAFPENDSIDDDDLPDDEAQQRSLSRRIQQSLDPYTRTFISVSATLRFPPPQPIRRMKELDDELTRAKRAWEDEVIRREEKAHPKISPETPPEPLGNHEQEITVTQGTDQDDINAQIENLPSLPRTPTPESTPMPSGDSAMGYFDMKASSLAPSSSSVALDTARPRTPGGELPVQLKTVEDISLESRLSYLKWQHDEQRRVWEWYLRRNKDDFVVEKYQCITLWEYTIPTADFGFRRPCTLPQMKYVTFYGENDCTLGQFVESSVMDTLVQFLDPKAICPTKGCDQPIARHCKVFVHNDIRLMVAVEQWDGQILGRSTYVPSPELITTWSACRICGMATPFIPVSEEMQRYSLGKFLELHFYPADVQLVQGAGCHHNIYQHHVRYFAKKGMTLRFQADPIAVHEIVYPPARIRANPEIRLELKNIDFERLHNRNMMWYTALMDDLKLINIDAASGDEEADLKLTADINVLIIRAEMEKDDIARLINQIYKDTAPTDTLGLNQVRSQRQDKIVAWQQDFDRLPKPRQPTIDRNSRRASAFGSVRAMWPRRIDMAPFDYHASSASVSEAEETLPPPLHRRVTIDSFASTSSASEASEAEPDSAIGTTKKGVVQSAVNEEALASESAKAAASDGDSDSTIGAIKEEVLSEGPISLAQDDESEAPGPDRSRPISRLPRRPVQQPSVAELVKKYQDFLPSQGMEELSKTAFAPPLVSESEPEAASPPSVPLLRIRSRHRNQVAARKASTSDFEQGYAANIASKASAQRRHGISRIPAPPPLDLTDTSRRTSPDKRRVSSDSRVGRSSSPLGHRPIPSAGSRIRQKTNSRIASVGKEKPMIPRSPNNPAKSTFRRAAPPGSKVSNIAKHFERMNRENERNTRRYAVINRGRRARPVASARAKVEILDSVKDAVRDESDSSDSSSEADDEGEGDDESPEAASKASDSFGSLPPQVDSETQSIILATESPMEMEMNIPEVVHTEPSPQRKPTFLLPVEESLEPPSMPPSPIMPSTPAHPARPLSPPVEDTNNERSSILKALTGLWPQPVPQSRFRSESDAEDLIVDPEHIFRDSSMVVRTDEPTSIIALALNSPLYREMLSRSRAEKRNAREPRLTTDGGEAFMPDDHSVAESTSTWGVVNVDAPGGGDPTEDLRMPSSKLPWAISFESSGLTIGCTVLYPEQFDALRRTCDCEKSMIESLARCIKWHASGGKSGSAFLKTLDDRFIAKEISRAELQTMETFAPAYFDYMSSSLTAGRPTLLAKIFGCFKVTYKTTNHLGPGKPKITQMNLVVMENLFYDRRFSKIFDLKGSTRNRHVQATGRESEVLLDENLNEIAHLMPFYLREHSKRILRNSLYNDSKFLADINVMDYSFVVGVDSVKNELVVGIVDYIRTYTWDKKLESWVKESAFLGGAGKGEPTIITPRQYRHRFLTAMERYFPLTPDRWMKQQDSPEDQW